MFFSYRFPRYLVTNSSPNLVRNLSTNLVTYSINRQIRWPIYYQIWWRIWWTTKFGDEVRGKLRDKFGDQFITKFGDQCSILFQSADIHSMCPARQIFGLALPHEKKTFLTLPCRMVILVSITYSRPEIGSILDLLERFLKSKVHSLYCWGAMTVQQMFCW